jgi:LuxR family maltose regulon positive regulatory protein
MLINQIAEDPEPFALVLDDYHVITTPTIHDMLMFLLEHQPPQMHLIIATRADPPLPLARLRGQGQITELYHSDLRFTTTEAAAFLKDTMHIALSPEAIAALEQRTEGWIAGLQMAAVSMQRYDNVDTFVQAFTGSHRYIFDYLIEEVLRHQPENVRRFLLQTSILDRLTAPLCDAVMEPDVASPNALSSNALSPVPGAAWAYPDITVSDSSLAEGGAVTGAAAILDYLERHNLFIVPLDDERRWYRYHRLFGDILHQHLQLEARELVPQLHQRASLWYQRRLADVASGPWYERHNMADRAIKHALQAEDYERVVGLVEQIAWEMLTWGEAVTLLRWLDGLSDAIVHSNPLLCVFYGWGLALTGQLDSVEPYLQTFDLQAVPGEVAALRSYVAGKQDKIDRALEFSDLAFKYLPEDNLFLRCVGMLSRGMAHLKFGQPEAAGDALRKAIKLSEAVGWDYLTLLVTTILGQAYEMRGRLQQAFEAHERALAQASGGAKRPAPFASSAYLGLAETCYEWNDLDGAQMYAMKGVHLSEPGDIAESLQAGYIVIGKVHLALGELAQAEDALREAERLAEHYAQAYIVALMADLKTRLWIARGDTRSALRWAESRRLDLDDAYNYARELDLLVLARVFIEGEGTAWSKAWRDEESGDVLDILAYVLERAEAAGRFHHAIKALVLQALAHHKRGDAEQALASLARALTLAKPGGYVRTFVDEGEPMTEMLRQALYRDVMPNYVAHLLAALGEDAEKPSPGMAVLVEPLTDRETEVLRLIVAGLSNQEIADQLYIAVSTVKSHVNHIYGKLAVENRTQAVIKVQELQLL